MIGPPIPVIELRRRTIPLLQILSLLRIELSSRGVEGGGGAPPDAAAGPLSEAELDQLEALMDSLPDTLEPLDVVMIDGYLCGVLLQPQNEPMCCGS